MELPVGLDIESMREGVKIMSGCSKLWGFEAASSVQEGSERRRIKQKLDPRRGVQIKRLSPDTFDPKRPVLALNAERYSIEHYMGSSPFTSCIHNGT